MSDKKDDTKKLPRFPGWVFSRIAFEPETNRREQEWRDHNKKYENSIFGAAHLAQMVSTNTVSNPRPKEQQEFMTKKAAKIKQAREDYASKTAHTSITGPSPVYPANPKEKKEALLGTRKEISYKIGIGNPRSKYNPDNTPRNKEILDRVTGSVKGGKPVSDEPKTVIKLGMKKDDKK